MKQSPFKFQGNTSKQVKKAEPMPDQADGKGKAGPLPKDLKKVQPKAKLNTTIRTGRPVNAQRPQGKG
jgi:hypothetical protein